MTANGHIIEIFKSRNDAARAMEEFERGERIVLEKQDVWVVGDRFVTEPGMGGVQLGQGHELDMKQFRIVATFTQEEFDAMMQQYYDDTEITQTRSAMGASCNSKRDAATQSLNADVPHAGFRLARAAIVQGSPPRIDCRNGLRDSLAPGLPLVP